MTSKHSPQQSQFPSLSSIILLIIFSSCLTQIASAKISCISSSSPIVSIQPGSEISLEFSGSQLDTALSAIEANLVCSSTGKSVLSLGKDYDATNYGPNSPKVEISVSQADEAMRSCPTNVFHLEYTTSSLLNAQTTKCKQNLSFILEKMAGLFDPITLPLPPIVPTSKESESPVSQTKTTTPVATTDSTTSAPPVQTTTPAITTSTPARTTKPPKSTSSVPPPAATTTTTRGGGGGGGGGKVTSTNVASPASPSASVSPESSSSADLENSSTSGPPTMIIVGASVGVVGGAFVILAAILVWRKRQQKKLSLDELFMGDSSLAAASGYSQKPINGRDEERGLSRNASVAASRSGEMTQQYGASPPPLMPTQTYHASAPNMGGHDMGYYNDVEGADHYQNQGRQNYRAPYNQPHYDYNSNGHRY